MSTPLLTRDSDGLLSSLSHPRLPNGNVNWRALIDPKHLYVNPDYEEELCARFNVKSRRDIDSSKVPDNQLLVALGGWQELLSLRGYRSLRYPILLSQPGYASATCEIEFIGNYETGGQPIIHSESAGANYHSVSGKFQLHLEAMATNRAFARCVRTFLKVPIYGKDEFDPEANKAFEAKLKEGENPLVAPKPAVVEAPQDMSIDPWGTLRAKCQNRKKPISFEALKGSALENKGDFISDPVTWVGLANNEGIPQRDIFTLMAKIDEADAKKVKK